VEISAASHRPGATITDHCSLSRYQLHWQAGKLSEGQEWTSVFVLNCVDGCIPSDLATDSTSEIEEERRLLYVAMTRAKDHLHLIVPQRFYAHQQRSNGDWHMYALRTRFIPDAITDYFEQCTWPAPIRESSSPAGAPLKTVPIGARLKQMWR
jgi:DNA helicase II / ATP-dependent DNA helicase PcrA